MQKKIRHNIILDLINKFEISTQEELTEKFIESGYEVSQATISRDIEELSLLKVAGKIKKYKYALPAIQNHELPQNILQLFKQITVSIIDANNLIVIKTLSGNANSAASVIDQMHINEVLGTLAGDDTLLIVTKSSSEALKVLKTLKNI